MLASFAILLALLAPADQPARGWVVAADGSGDFRTVQAAIAAVSAQNRERIVIQIKAGTYREQVRIHQSYVTLRGEGREKTRIEANVDTSVCATTPEQSKEEQCATLIADGSDLVFENLTVANTYHGDKGKGAALAIVGDATRAIVAHVDIVGYGGDTLVLSARRTRLGDGGEYYLNDVYVSGTYHILVPRGTTYATGCRFWCLGGERICLFSEGITRESDKLVIRDSAIDGPEPFGLGSYFRDTAWYFIHNTISDKLKADGQIFRAPAQNYAMKWGEGRIYFAGNRAPDYPWLRDNLDQSPAKDAASVTAAWTLPDWNPESMAPPVVRVVQRAGNTISILFDESVTVQGEPRVKFASGDAAVFAGGSGTDTLLFHARRPGRPLSFDWNGGTILASGASLHRRDADAALPPSR